MNTKKIFFALFLTAVIFVPFTTSAQVTIGSAVPPRATLDVVASEGTPAGIIVPNVSRARLIADTHSAAQTGAIVFVNAIDGTANPQTINVTEAGFYYFDGTVWLPLIAENIGITYTAGNLITIDANNAINVASSAAANRVIGVTTANSAPQYLQVNRLMLNPTPNTGVFPASTSAANDFVMPYHMGLLPSTDLNEIRNPGFYRINVATTNSPVTTGTNANSAVLQVMAASGTRLSQMLFHNNGRVFTRTLQNTTWSPWVDITENTTYTGSTSIHLDGTSFERAALTGDVTAARNSNETTVARIQGRNVAAAAPTGGQALMWNPVTSAWTPGTPPNTTYTGSTSIVLSGTSFQRAALTGDVTAPANSNATTIADNAVTTRTIAPNAVTNAEIANNAVAIRNLPAGATAAAFLRGDGTWVVPPNENTTYTGSTSIILNDTSFERAALTGDVTAAQNSNATTVTAIRGRNLAAAAPTAGQVLAWNAATSAWTPTTIATAQHGGSTSIILSGTSFQRAALTGDVTAAQNNNETTVARIQGRNVAAAAPTAGQVLTWNAATSAWTPATPAAPAASWLLGGNTSGITSVNNILGINQTSTQPLRIFTNAAERIRITSAGNVGIGTTAPSQALDIDGQIRIRGGNPRAGRVLTSSLNGTAAWEESSYSLYRVRFTNSRLELRNIDNQTRYQLYFRTHHTNPVYIRNNGTSALSLTDMAGNSVTVTQGNSARIIRNVRYHIIGSGINNNSGITIYTTTPGINLDIGFIYVHRLNSYNEFRSRFGN